MSEFTENLQLCEILNNEGIDPQNFAQFMREQALQLQQMQPDTELQTINESDISDDSFLVSDHQSSSPTSIRYASSPSSPSKNKRKAISLHDYQSTPKKVKKLVI